MMAIAGKDDLHHEEKRCRWRPADLSAHTLPWVMLVGEHRMLTADSRSAVVDRSRSSIDDHAYMPVRRDAAAGVAVEGSRSAVARMVGNQNPVMAAEAVTAAAMNEDCSLAESQPRSFGQVEGLG